MDMSKYRQVLEILAKEKGMSVIDFLPLFPDIERSAMYNDMIFHGYFKVEEYNSRRWFTITEKGYLYTRPWYERVWHTNKTDLRSIFIAAATAIVTSLAISISGVGR